MRHEVGYNLRSAGICHRRHQAGGRRRAVDGGPSRCKAWRATSIMRGCPFLRPKSFISGQDQRRAHHNCGNWLDCSDAHSCSFGEFDHDPQHCRAFEMGCVPPLYFVVCFAHWPLAVIPRNFKKSRSNPLKLISTRARSASCRRTSRPRSRAAGARSRGSWREDSQAPGGKKVLVQESADDTSYRFPLCIYDKADATRCLRRGEIQGDLRQRGPGGRNRPAVQPGKLLHRPGECS